jgi:hypothetical protein
VNEPEPRETGIEGLLRRSLAGPAPELPADFDRRVLRGLRRSAQGGGRRGRILVVGGYGVVSAAVSAVVMRGQGLGWEAVTVLVLSAVALVAAGPLARSLARRGAGAAMARGTR